VTPSESAVALFGSLGSIYAVVRVKNLLVAILRGSL
jgi:hypothetical protein